MILACLAALGCTLAACDSSTDGSAKPAPSSSPARSSTPLAGLDPCQTLDKALAGQGFPPSEPSAAYPKQGCIATKPTFGSAGLLLQDGRSYKDNISDPSTTSTGDVNHRAAILERKPVDSVGDCVVDLEVKPKSRAVVGMSLSSGSTDQSCTSVRQLAEAAEPLLPK